MSLSRKRLSGKRSNYPVEIKQTGPDHFELVKKWKTKTDATKIKIKNLPQAEEDIQEKHTKIHNLQARVMKNDETIRKLLESVVAAA